MERTACPWSQSFTSVFIGPVAGSGERGSLEELSQLHVDKGLGDGNAGPSYRSARSCRVALGKSGKHTCGQAEAAGVRWGPANIICGNSHQETKLKF